MDEDKDFIHAESETYPITSLLADVGGAAGLFLGLSVIVKNSKNSKKFRKILKKKIFFF